MIDAGLPLVQCLEILRASRKQILSEGPDRHARQVEAGATLSAAMRTSPKVFDALYVNMVEAGETAVFSTPFCNASRLTSRRTSSCSAPSSPRLFIRLAF